MERNEFNVVPYTLTIKQAAEYFGIGQNKLREICNENKNASFVLWNGTKVLIKRKIFEEFIDETNVL